MWTARSLPLCRLTKEFSDNKARKWGPMFKVASWNLNSIRSRLTNPPATRSCRLFEVRHVNPDTLSGVTKTEETGSSEIALPEPATDYEVMGQGVPLGMCRMNPEHKDLAPSGLAIALTILLREEPDDEDEDEEEHDGGEDDDDGDEGYSE